MLFYSLFKTLVGKEIVVELKNDLAIRGQLHSVDQYLNIKLLGVSVEDAANFPHLQSVKDCFIRGSVVRYVQLPSGNLRGREWSGGDKSGGAEEGDRGVRAGALRACKGRIVQGQVCYDGHETGESCFSFSGDMVLLCMMY